MPGIYQTMLRAVLYNFITYCICIILYIFTIKKLISYDFHITSIIDAILQLLTRTGYLNNNPVEAPWGVELQLRYCSQYAQIQESLTKCPQECSAFKMHMREICQKFER